MIEAKLRSRLCIFVSLWLFIFLISCSPIDGTPLPIYEETTMPNSQNTQQVPIDSYEYGEEVLYSAYNGGQIIVKGDFLRIGVGAVRSGEYLDNDGNLQSGTIAHLSFFVRGRPELEQDLDVYEGKIITVAGYRVRVTDVNNDEKLVVIKIATPIKP